MGHCLLALPEARVWILVAQLTLHLSIARRTHTLLIGLLNIVETVQLPPESPPWNLHLFFLVDWVHSVMT